MRPTQAFVRSVMVIALATLGAGCGQDLKYADDACVASSECASGLVCDFGRSPPTCQGQGTPPADAGPVPIDAAPGPDAPPGAPDASVPPAPDASVPPAPDAAAPDAAVPDAAVPDATSA